MTTTEGAARRATASPTLQRVARSGLATRGVLYLVVAILAVALAFGRRVQPDSQGALRAVAHQRLGIALLALLALGLAANAGWQALLAIAGPTDARDRRDAAVSRVANVGRALLYGGLAVVAVQLVLGAHPDASSTREQQDWTGRVLRWPGGRAVVVIVGLAIVVAGAVATWRGFDGRFRRDLHVDEMSDRMRRVVSALAKAGIAARGVVAALVGAFVVQAAVTFDPADSSGIDGALAKLRHARSGPVLLVVVAAGLAAYGLFTFALARYGDLTGSSFGPATPPGRTLTPTSGSSAHVQGGAMARVRVDPDRCVGHGRCYALAPEVFDADDEGHCVIPDEHVEGEREVQARVGEESCPENAITVEDD